MKKRFLAILLAFVMVVSMLPLAAYADDCSHEKTIHDIVYPTCKTEGKDKLVCDDCGAVISTTTLEKEPHIFVPNVNNGNCLVCNTSEEDACDHDYEITREEPATCVLTGYVWKKCKLCGKEKNQETPIDADAHEQFVNGKCACGYECPHETTYTDSVQGTCATEGYTKVICDTCEKVLSQTTLEKTNEHTFLPNHKDGQECLRCGANKQDVCEHDYEIVKAEAGTCSLNGYAWEICKLCGKEYNHETDMIPSAHSFVNGKCTACFKPCQCDMEYQDIKMPSCNEEGYRKVRCLKCDKILSETILEKTNEHLFLSQYENGTKCRLCDANLQDVCEHDYEIVREQSGTCIETGYVWMECKLCNKEYNHETEIDPEGHDYMIIDQEEATCEAPAHVWKRCILCANRADHDEGEAAGHEFENGKCAVCGAPDPNCPHTNHVEDVAQYRAATCTVDGVRVYDCPACGTEQREAIPMLGHERVESTSAPTCTATGTRYVNCTRCRMLLNTEVIPATGHTFVGGTCACGASDPNACIHPQNMRSTHTQAATCTVDGYTHVVCDACGATISAQVHKANGHTETVTVQAATCSKNGSRTVTCTTCHEQRIEVLPATGRHDYANGVCSGCGTVDPNKYTSDFQDIFLVG